jgi:hypothetical protein
MEEALHTRILAFPRQHDLAALATVDAERAVPECAIVGIAPTEHIELVFGTALTNRTFRNVPMNPPVALMIGWSSVTGPMQDEGVAEEISASSLDRYVPHLLASNPDHARFADQPGQRFFLVRPVWIRFFDVHRTDEVTYLETSAHQLSHQCEAIQLGLISHAHQFSPASVTRPALPAASLPHGNPARVKHATDRAKRITYLFHHLIDRQPTLIEPDRPLGILGCHRLFSK